MLSKLLKLLILVVILSSCANNMDKQNKDQSSKLLSEKEDKANKLTSKEENEKDNSKLSIDKAELKIPQPKTIQFGDKSTEEIISFFEKYKVKFFENDRKVDGFIENQDGNLVSIDKFDEDKFPSEPSLAWYVYKDKLYMLITPMETSEKSDLSLYILDKSGEVEKKTLIENINELAPLFVYDSNKLFYSSDTGDGKSILAMINLDDYSITKLKEYDFTKEADLYKGSIITQLAKFDDDIVYQLSSFDNKNVRDEKARENKLLSLTNPNKEIDLSDKTFEYMKKLGRYIVCHPKSNKDFKEPVEIYDEDFKLLLKLKNNPIERLVDTALLNRDGKAYLLIKDSLATHYLIDLVDKEENYQLNNISTVGRDLYSIDNKLVLNLSDATYIGYIDE